MVDHAEMFWSCPSIQTFWKKVVTIITLGFGISTTFTSLYLGHIPDRLSKILTEKDSGKN